MTTSPPLCTVGDACRGRDPTGAQLAPREVFDRGFLCGVCRRRLERWISDLPALHAELADALLPGGGLGSGKPSYRNAWPVNPAALSPVRYELDVLGKLASWTWLIVVNRGVTPPRHVIYVRPPVGHEGPAAPRWVNQVDIPTLAAWLTVHTDWIAHWHWGHEMYAEIRELHWAIYAAVYPNRDRKRFPLPRHRRTCPDCAGDLYAIVTGQTHQGTMVQCSACGREWAPIEWFRLGRRILNTPQRKAS